METMHYELSRALKRYGHNFDITKRQGISFTSSIEAYEDAQTERKSLGHGHIQSYKEIPIDGKFPLICYIEHHHTVKDTTILQ